MGTELKKNLNIGPFESKLEDKAKRLEQYKATKERVAQTFEETSRNYLSRRRKGRLDRELILLEEEALSKEDRVAAYQARHALHNDPLSSTESLVLRELKERGGILRVKYCDRLGISRNTVYSMVKKKALYQIHRGVYRVYNAEDLTTPDYFYTFVSCENAVLCLISALSFHDLTDEIPIRVEIAMERGAAIPSVSWPPIKVHFFSKVPFESGMLIVDIDGINGKVYSKEKTLADCFKFRNKIGLDIVLKALGRYLQSDDSNISELLHQARVCRVYNVLRPYVEAFVQDV